MEFIKIGDKEVTISELTCDDVTMVDLEQLESINKVLDDWQYWSDSSFELIIAKPKLFMKLLSSSTGLKKKHIKSLSAKDFDSLAFVFLSVNAEFFIQRLKLIQMAK